MSRGRAESRGAGRAGPPGGGARQPGLTPAWRGSGFFSRCHPGFGCSRNKASSQVEVGGFIAPALQGFGGLSCGIHSMNLP